MNLNSRNLPTYLPCKNCGLPLKISEKYAGMIEEGIKKGIKKGDRVAAYLPNVPETIIAMLASSSIGAVFSSASPDFGVEGVLDR